MNRGLIPDNVYPECNVYGLDSWGLPIWMELAVDGEQRHFFIEGDYYGAYPAAPIQRQGAFFKPDGLFFFCTLCGRIWAECPVDRREGRVHYALCRRHNRSETNPVLRDSTYPGSIWIDWDREWNAQLPKNILAREFILCYGNSSSPHITPYRDDLEIDRTLQPTEKENTPL